MLLSDFTSALAVTRDTSARATSFRMRRAALRSCCCCAVHAGRAVVRPACFHARSCPRGAAHATPQTIPQTAILPEARNRLTEYIDYYCKRGRRSLARASQCR